MSEIIFKSVRLLINMFKINEMNTFDMIVIGAGRVGRQIALRLHEKKRRVLLIKLPGAPEARLDAHLGALFRVKPQPAPELPAGLECREGMPRFLSRASLQLNNETCSAKKFILAMGAVPKAPNIADPLRSRARPVSDIDFTNPHFSSALVVGGGPSGVSAAALLAQAGVKTMLLHHGPRLLPNMDKEISDFHADVLLKKGVRHVQELNESDSNVDVIVSCAGFSPNTEGFGLKEAGVFVRPDGIVATDEELRTSDPAIWAVGALTEGPHSAPFEDSQAALVVHNTTALWFDRQKFESDAVPMAYPTIPPTGKSGLGEEEARKKYKDVRATCAVPAQGGGLIKIVARSRSGELLGVQAALPGAPELMALVSLGLRCGATVEELAMDQFSTSFSASAEFTLALKKWLNAPANEAARQ